ncbi:MAG: hypothetical protein RJB22_2214, partial [Pseudomonadota bacterium]
SALQPFVPYWMRSQALAWRDVLKMDDMQHDPPRLQVLGISLVKIGRKQYR